MTHTDVELDGGLPRPQRFRLLPDCPAADFKSH